MGCSAWPLPDQASPAAAPRRSPAGLPTRCPVSHPNPSGQFNQTSIAIGLQHLLLRTTAGAARAAEEAAGAGAQAAREQPAAEAAAAGTGSKGSTSRQLTLDFLVGPLSAWQQSHVRTYLRSPLWSGTAWRRSTLVLLSLCVWEQEVATPE